MDRRLIGAAAACAVAAILFGASLVDAIDAGAPVATPVTPRTEAPVATTTADPVISAKAVDEAVAFDPFSADRRAPDTPYRLPTDPAPEQPAAAPPPPPPIPGFHLVGTTQTPSGPIALIQVDNANPRVVAVGESMNGYTVTRIDRTSASLAQGDRRVDLQLQQPLARVETPQGGRRGIPVRPQQGRGAAALEMQQTKQLMQEMQDMLTKRATVEATGRRIRPDTTAPRLQR